MPRRRRGVNGSGALSGLLTCTAMHTRRVLAEGLGVTVSDFVCRKTWHLEAEFRLRRITR